MEHIKQTLQSVFKNIEKKGSGQSAKAFRLFLSSLKKAERKHVKCTYLRQGILSVNVDSSAWLYQLNLKKGSLLNKLGLKDIRLRIGEVK